MRHTDSTTAIRPSSRFRGWILVCLVLLALAAANFYTAPASAAAARFTFDACDSALPNGGKPATLNLVNEQFRAFNDCASPGGAIGLETPYGSALNSTFAYWSVGMPATPGGYVEQITISANACNLNAANSNTYVFEGLPTGPPWPGNNCLESHRLFHVRDSPPTSPFNFGAGFNILMNCDGNHGNCQGSSTILAHYFAATEVDVNAPSISSLRGTLLAGGPIRGRQSIGADLSDKGGGLSGAEVLVNGVPTGKPLIETCNVVAVSNSSVVGRVAISPTPCPSAEKADWTLDTESYPFRDGANSVSVCGSDFATLGEPNRSCTPARVVQVDNSCTPAAVDGGELLSAQFTASHDDTLTVAYGKKATVSGRLATNAGDPVRGAALCVKMGTIGVDPRPSAVGTVVTDANGEYDYELPPGPNRQLVIGYRYDTRQLARDVSYYAHVRPTLKRDPPRLANGKRVRLWGKLPGPRAGKRVVVLQANVPGSKRWITFKRANTDAAGAFHSSYRFSSTSRKTRYRFRALVPRQAGYPWIEGHSKPVIVTVTP
jgi:hypothetical protein